MGSFVETFVPVPVLDVPVPQSVEQLVDVPTPFHEFNTRKKREVLARYSDSAGHTSQVVVVEDVESRPHKAVSF